MSENLLKSPWSDLDQMDLRLLLAQRIGGRGQLDGDENVLHLPSGDKGCRVSLVYKDAKLKAINPGPAFDRAEWGRISTEIETSILRGPQRIGRDLSLSSYRVEGWWRGARSGVQILPAPNSAPRDHSQSADDPFILEFPVNEASVWEITNHRRIREHRRLTLLLNVLLAATIKFVPNRHKHLWAVVGTRSDGKSEYRWVWEYYPADVGEAVVDALSSPTGQKIEELEADRYYKEVGNDGRPLRVPSDLDDSIWWYQNLKPNPKEKFDRAMYWMSMASYQWEASMSASFASLVSAAEALTERGTSHSVYCCECKENRQHDVPGATENFRALFEKYTPDPGLRKRRTKMYDMRSSILHGTDLMQLDQDRAFGWDPPGWNEWELNTELWNLMRVAARNWLRNPPA
jgi:hypothetical protein